MHIAWVTYISPQDMAFQSQMVPYPLFTTKFNVEGGTMQHHLTIKYIYIYITPYPVLHFLGIYMSLVQ